MGRTSTATFTEQSDRIDNGKMRVGIIGGGMITQRSQAAGLTKVEGMELAAACDTNPDSRAKVR